MATSLEVAEIAGAGLPVRVKYAEVMACDVAVLWIAVKAALSQ